MSDVADQLLEAFRSKQQLYGGDIDVMTDVMDDIVKRVDTVAIDANSSTTVHQLFQASDSHSEKPLVHN